MTGPASFLEAQAVFEAKLPGYTRRAHQLALAERVEQAIADEGILLAQAGTGTGKSFALMGPAIISGRRTVVAVPTKALQDQYCVAPWTRILTADLRYITAGQVTEGMELAAFDENPATSRGYRQYRKATVISADTIQRPCYRITFDDGTVITSSAEHRWLVSNNMGSKWMTTEDLREAAGKRVGSSVVRLFDAWEGNKTWDAGYLAAAYDGEGHLAQHRSPRGHAPSAVTTALVFSQKPNVMLDQVRKSLDELGFPYRMSERADCHQVYISHRRNIVRLLGQVRPERLLQKFDIGALGAINMHRRVQVVRKDFIGMMPVVAIKTTTGTYIAEGLASHNCGDLTFLEENLGTEFSWAILKGRSNYPCWVKAKAVEAPTYGQREVLKSMAENESPREGKIIDRESFPALSREEWRAFSMSADECPGASSCPFANQCFTERAKARAAAAQVVVTNLAYLLQDLKLRLASNDNVVLLGEIEQLVIDEAHMLPEAVTSALEDSMSEYTFKVLARDLAGYLEDFGRDTESTLDIERATEALWAALVQSYGAWAKGDQRVTDPMALTVTQLISPDGFGDLFAGLYQAIEAARDEVKATRAMTDDEEIRRARMMRRTASAMQRIFDFTTDPPEKTVRWAEPEDKVIRGERFRRYTFRSAPVQVGPFLRATIWERVPAVLSSATLAAGTDFTPLMDLMGLRKDEAGTYDAGSPFDFGRQATLLVPPKDAPDPRDQTVAWRSYAQAVTQFLVTRSQGGALLLFTSRSAMKESYEALAPGFRAAGLHVMIQDGDTPSGQLVRAMKENGNAVLFALRTFFQGIDIQGRALRLVIIDKLPFPVPSDLVYKAREADLIRRYRSEWAGFTRLMIPSMILDLTQAFGRLIRHRDDYGVVAILDPRLSSKRYGAQILKALPPASLTRDPAEAAAFLEAIIEEPAHY